MAYSRSEQTLRTPDFPRPREVIPISRAPEARARVALLHTYPGEVALRLQRQRELHRVFGRDDA